MGRGGARTCEHTRAGTRIRPRIVIGPMQGSRSSRSRSSRINNSCSSSRCRSGSSSILVLTLVFILVLGLVLLLCQEKSGPPSPDWGHEEWNGSVLVQALRRELMVVVLVAHEHSILNSSTLFKHEGFYGSKGIEEIGGILPTRARERGRKGPASNDRDIPMYRSTKI